MDGGKAGDGSSFGWGGGWGAVDGWSALGSGFSKNEKVARRIVLYLPSGRGPPAGDGEAQRKFFPVCILRL